MRHTIDAMQRRYQQSFDPRWVDAMVYRLTPETWMRWFDSGDLDERLLPLIVEVCRRTPKTQHWIASREVELVRDYLRGHDLPPNVTIRLSADYLDQVTDLPSIPGCVVSTVTRDAKAEQAHNCPVTFATDAAIDSCESAGCRACWQKSVKWVNYNLHSETRASAFVAVAQADMRELEQHLIEPVADTNVSGVVPPVDLAAETMQRMRVDDILALFRTRLEQIQRHGGFAVLYATGREINFFASWIRRVEQDAERQARALIRLRDVYGEFRIPETTAQLWRRVVEQFDPVLDEGCTSMEMLAEVGIGKLDVIVSLAELNTAHWGYGPGGEILLSEAITEGPFDVRELTVDDLKDLRKCLLEMKRLAETPVQVRATPSCSPAIPSTSDIGSGLGTDSPRDQTCAHREPTAPPTLTASETAIANMALEAKAEVTTSVTEARLTDACGQSWAVRTCNAALAGWDSTVSALEIIPEIADIDAYAVLQASGQGDGTPPRRRLLWFDDLTHRTLDFPLT